MKYDRSIFSKQLGTYEGIEMSNTQNSDGTYKYDQMTGTSGNLNKRLQYAKDGHNFTTWFQESSEPDSQAYKFVTCKLDYARTVSEDDHCTLFGAFMNSSDGPLMVAGMASINFQNDSDDNVVSGLITGDNIPQDIYSALNDQIKDIDFSTSEKGRKSIPDIIRANFEAMQASIFPE